jgi:hypothetical protein
VVGLGILWGFVLAWGVEGVMVSKLIRALIVLAVAVLCVYVVLWVLAHLGIALPAMVVQIIWVIVVLLVLLYLWNTFGGDLRAGL